MAQYAAEADAAYQLARQIVGTAFVPDTLYIRDEDHNINWDRTIQTVAVALTAGAELGLKPHAAMKSIHLVHGSPGLAADTMVALLQLRGHQFKHPELTNTRAITQGRRADSADWESISFTIDDIKRLQLRGAFGPMGAYTRMPRTMLRHRADAEMCRMLDPGALLGMPYSAEELQYMQDGAGFSGEAGDADGEAPGKTSEVRPTPRRRVARRSTSKAPAASGKPAGALAPAGAVGGPETAPRAPAGPDPTTDQPITRSQLTALWAGMGGLGYTDADEARRLVGEWAGRVIESSTDLTAAEASTVLDKIAELEKQRAADAARQEQDAAAEAPDPDGVTVEDPPELGFDPGEAPQ
jgi:hypothetical protein